MSCHWPNCLCHVVCVPLATAGDIEELQQCVLGAGRDGAAASARHAAAERHGRWVGPGEGRRQCAVAHVVPLRNSAIGKRREQLESWRCLAERHGRWMGTGKEREDVEGQKVLQQGSRAGRWGVSSPSALAPLTRMTTVLPAPLPTERTAERSPLSRLPLFAERNTSHRHLAASRASCAQHHTPCSPPRLQSVLRRIPRSS